MSRLYLGRFSDVHIGGPSSNQATSLESQMIHPIQLLPGRTLRDGSLLPGWPVDVATALAANSQTFNPRDQGQRGALAIVDGVLFVPFGGHFGDCGDYHGWIIGISLRDPQVVASWATRARGGGIWAPGGISTDGKSLFVATGNTIDAAAWGDGEAVFRLPPDLRRADRTQDHYAPADWHELDRRDADLGGTNPLPLDVPTENGTQALVLALERIPIRQNHILRCGSNLDIRWEESHRGRCRCLPKGRRRFGGPFSVTCF